MITLEIPAPEFVKRFQAGEIPADALVTVSYENQEVSPQNLLRAKLHQWQQETATKTTAETETSELFRQWDEEDAHMTGEERRAEKQLWEEFENGINENRALLGMRQL